MIETTSPIDEATETRSAKLAERQELLRRFTEIIKQQGDRGIGTGLERSARWQKVMTRTGETEASSPSGNAKNAAVTAKAAATKVRVVWYLPVWTEADLS